MRILLGIGAALMLPLALLTAEPAQSHLAEKPPLRQVTSAPLVGSAPTAVAPAAVAPQAAPGGLPYSHDLTADQLPDVVAARGDGGLVLYPGNGRGGFLSGYPQIGAGWQGRDITVHAQDWDRSGARDVIARDPATGNLWLYSGNGRGGFSGQNVIGGGWNAFTAIIAPGDFAGDGNPDLVTVRPDGAMNLYPGTGTGGFGASYPQIGAGWQTRDAITSVGDFDGDGSHDLIAREPATGSLWLYSGNGAGGFRSQRVIGSGWNVFTALVGPGDFDGDGANDVLARTGNGDLYLYPGNGRGGFGTSYPRIGAGWTGLGIVSAGTSAGPVTQPWTARALLAALTVAPETTTGYDRAALFGSWIDADRDGCTTRSEVLQRQTLAPLTYSTGCTVATGRWYSYLDLATWTVAGDVDIDHHVPLKEAWDSGASSQSWTATRRLAYANDLGYLYSLEAITDNVNQSKGDRDVAEWLPPATSAHCTYAIRWVAVKYRWSLTVDSREHASLDDLLTGACGDYRIPAPPRS